MMLPTASLPLPGLYPMITKIKPRIGGRNNIGVGVDTHQVEYVLKTGNLICVAELIGAALCAALKVPHCRGAIVTRQRMDGSLQYLFGSIIEPDVHRFDQSSIEAWKDVVAELRNTALFTIMLAVDLAIGNDDRHAANWIVRRKAEQVGRARNELLAMDFSNAWPLAHPPYPPREQPSSNTWDITQHWPDMGIEFESCLFRSTCAKISALDQDWLNTVLDPLVGIWLTPMERDNLCAWWDKHWRQQVIDVIHSLEPDGAWL